jgi:ribonuclease P/MRP protein subunit RPP25
MTITDKYEPKIEGLEPTETVRKVTAFDCILSKDPLDETDPGYQPPKAPEEPSQNKPLVKQPKPVKTYVEKADA